MAAKLTRLIHKIAIQLQLVAESCTICSSQSRQPVQKLLDTPYNVQFELAVEIFSSSEKNSFVWYDALEILETEYEEYKI
jgi:hypothetical protein